MSRSVNVACLQLEAPGGLTPSQTAERARALISDVEDVDLIVLPELWATGYFNFQNYRADAQPLDDCSVSGVGLVVVVDEVAAWGVDDVVFPECPAVPDPGCEGEHPLAGAGPHTLWDVAAVGLE